MLANAKVVPVTNFELKNTTVELCRTGSENASMTVEALEAIRMARTAVPASKHSLEVICGASCETAAQ